MCNRKISPCPFCGNTYPLVRGSEGDYWGYSIECPVCQISFSVGGSVARSHRKQSVIDAWNKRAQPAGREQFQVITYHPDTGTYERKEYSTASVARQVAQCYIDTGEATAALVYDLTACRIVCAFGDFLPSARPTER